MLKTIKLYGRLRDKFGPEYSFVADSPADVIRGLCCLVEGFEAELRSGSYKFLRGARSQNNHIPMELVHFGLGKTSELHLIPAVEVANKRGLGKILIGAALIGTAFITGGASLTALGATGSTLGIAATGLAGVAVKVGVTLALGGLSTLLTARTGSHSGDAQERRESALFSGAQNTAQQGVAVPLVYGRVRAGSVVISAGLNVEQTRLSGSTLIPSPGIGSRSSQNLYNRNLNASVVLEKGGKSGSSGSSGQEDPNTLQSNSTARVIDLISEGPIGGLAAEYLTGDPNNALQSVYLDDVPIMNNDGTFNYKGILVESKVGNPSDDPLKGFSDVESEIGVGVAVTQVTPIVRAVTDTNVESIRLTVQLPSLYKVNDEDGAIRGTNVNLAVDIRDNGNPGGYVQVMTDNITGKTNTPYQRAYRINLPGDGPWNVRVRRLTPDSTEATLQNSLTWQSLTEIVESRLMYPNSAVVGVTVDARQFGSNIPDRDYDVFGRIIRVPANYDPETRAYATSGPGTTNGVWDGSFKLEWTDNPAWILYDLISHPRYGLGELIPEDYPNKWVLYEIGQHCDELVPDGAGGMEPRYTVNTQLVDRTEAFDLLLVMVSVFRGMFYWGSGSIEFSYDHDELPSKLVTKANVLDGKLNYSTDTFESRHSVAIVSWNDPELRFEPNFEIVEDPDLIERYGYKEVRAAAWGSTSRGQAHRVGRWMLDTEKFGELLNYAAGIDHSDVRPGTVIEVNDPEYTSQRMAGRLAAGSTTSQLRIDYPVTLEAGLTYTIKVILPDGAIDQRTVTNGAGETSAINCTPALSQIPLNGAIWSLAASNAQPRLFRVIGVEESGPLEYNILAMWHDPNKFARVEQGLDLPPNTFSNVPTGPLEAPPEVNLFEFLYREGDAAMPGLLASWEAPKDPRVTKYQYQVQRPESGDWEPGVDLYRVSDEIRDITPGIWAIRVRSLDDLGHKSGWTGRGGIVIDAALDPIAEVVSPSVTFDIATLTTTLSWAKPQDVRPLRYEVFLNDDDNYDTSVSLGIVDSLSYTAPAQGFYWVRTVFGAQTSQNPQTLVVDASNLPDAAIFDGRVLDGLTKLSGISDGATRNTGALADLDTLGLGDERVTGLLPVAKADPGLQNQQLVPSISSAAETAQWTQVDDRPLNLSQLDAPANANIVFLLSDVNNLQNSVGDLVTVFGDTESSAINAALAEAARENAVIAQGLVDQALAQTIDEREAAEGFASIAGDHAGVAFARANEAGAEAGAARADRILAQTARGETSVFRDQAVIARDAAQGAANTATVQAGLSSGFRDQSQAFSNISSQQATIATAGATSATTTLGQISTLVGQAGASLQAALNAEQRTVTARDRAETAQTASASSSLQSQGFRDEARRLTGNKQPITFENNSAFFAGIDGTNGSYNRGEFVNDPTHGPVFQHTANVAANQFAGIAPRQRLPNYLGKKFKVNALGRRLSGSTGNLYQFRLIGMNRPYLPVEGPNEARTSFQLLTVGGASSSTPEVISTEITSTSNAPFIELNLLVFSGEGSREQILSLELLDNDAVSQTQISAQATIAAEQRTLATEDRVETLESNVSQSRLAVDAALGQANGARDVAIANAGITTTNRTLTQADRAETLRLTELNSSLAAGYINPNASFHLFDAPNIPNSWTNSSGSVVNKTRVAGVGSNPNALRIVGVAGENSFIAKNAATAPANFGTLIPNNWYVVRARITLESGTLNGAGVYFNPVNSVAASLTSLHRVTFTGNDINGVQVGLGTVGNTYEYGYIVKVPANSSGFNLFAMAHWSDFNPAFNNGIATAGSISVANAIIFHEVGVRTATSAEIATQTVLPPLQASVTTTQATVATLQGAAVTYDILAAATGSSPARIGLRAGINGSRVDLAGERIILINEANGQQFEVARFENGVANFNQALIRRLNVFPRTDSQFGLPVQLATFTLLGSDGQTIQYRNGLSMGARAQKITPNIAGLPALAAGQSYDIRAVNDTPTGFTARAKVIGAAATQNVMATGGVNAGNVTPRWQMEKPTAADASDGNYQFKFNVTLPRTQANQEPQGNGVIFYDATYEGTVDVYVANSTATGWVLVKTINIAETRFSTSGFPAASLSVNVTDTINIGQAIGQRAAREFGVHATSSSTTINSFTEVQYNTRSAASETAVTQLISWEVTPPSSN